MRAGGSGCVGRPDGGNEREGKARFTKTPMTLQRKINRRKSKAARASRKANR